MDTGPAGPRLAAGSHLDQIQIRQLPHTGDGRCLDNRAVESAEPRLEADLAAVYEPIRDHMVCFELALDEVIDDAPADISDMLTQALKGGGKRLRPALVLFAGSLYPGRVEPLISAAVGYELLHTATLVHDDTIDRAVTRRGMVTANALWGDQLAVRLGDYLCGCSALMIARTGSRRAMKVFSHGLADLCAGAITEHAAGWTRGRVEYFTTISGKTASLFSAASESGAVVSAAPKRVVQAIRHYGHNLGMAFQTLDDIHDCRSDLSQGGFPLPAILLLEEPRNRWVADLLDRDPAAGLDTLAAMIANSSVLEDCLRIAWAFCQEALSTLDCFPPGRLRDSLEGLVTCIADQKA